MNELIAGYTAYTTAEEYGTAAAGDAPATFIIVTTVITAVSLSVGGTLVGHC